MMKRRTFLNWFYLSSITSSLFLLWRRALSQAGQKLPSNINTAQIQSLPTNYVNVREFGSLVSGITNQASIIKANTATIQAAINAVGKNGGGNIYIPQGIYQIAPPDLNIAEPSSLVINYDNITLFGDGIGKTILQSRGDYSLIDGKVVRGHGILIKGTPDDFKPRKNVTIKNLELSGGIKGFTGNRNWPADPANGDGWDLTHKGIVLDFNTHLDNITVDSVDVHDFKGEVIYGGGDGIKKVTISKTKLSSSNASMLSLDADLTVTECEFYQTAMAWVENAPISPNKNYNFYKCVFKDSRYQGLVIGQGNFANNHKIVISNCSFCNSPAGVCAFGGISNLTIKNNIFNDCKNSLFIAGNNRDIEFSFNEINGKNTEVTSANLADSLMNVSIKNNVLKCADRLAKVACVFYWGNLQNIVIENNTFENCRTPEQSSILTKERPLFRNNRYLNVERRELQGTANFWQSPPYIVEPKFEEIVLKNNTNNRIIQVNISTDYYVDGQEVMIMLDGSKGQIKFPNQNDRYLNNNGEKIKLKFNKSERKWYEIADSSSI